MGWVGPSSPAGAPNVVQSAGERARVELRPNPGHPVLDRERVDQLSSDHLTPWLALELPVGLPGLPPRFQVTTGRKRPRR